MIGLPAFARNRLGVELFPAQAMLLDAWAHSGRRKTVLALGRRSGKDLMTAVAAIFNAAVPDYSASLRPGERRFIVIVATRQEQAREFVRVVRELLDNAPDRDLADLVDLDASTLDEVVFRTGVVIRAMPCSSRSTRGLAVSLLVLNEAAHMSTAEDGFAAGKRVYQALLPSTAQFGESGYVMVLSSPLWASGLLWDLYNAGATGAVGDTFVERRPTWVMNPRITRESLDAEFLADPDSARSEYGAEFAEGAGAYLTATAITECLVPGRSALAPAEGVIYAAACDPAFAAGGDAFTFAIAHSIGEGDEQTVVLDRIEAWQGKRSPLNSDAVLDEIAALAQRYGIRRVTSDQYAVVPLADGLRRRGIELVAQPLTNELKADVYGALKRLINTGRVELLDDTRLRAELIGLEIRPTPSGKPRIDAAARGHDDRAMAVATVAHALVKRRPLQRTLRFRGTGTGDRPGSSLPGLGDASGMRWRDLSPVGDI